MKKKPDPFLFVFDDGKQVIIFYTRSTTPIIALAVEKFNFNYKIITRSNIANDWINSCPDQNSKFYDLTEVIQKRLSPNNMAHFENGGMLSLFCFDGVVSISPFDVQLTELDAAMLALRSKEAYCDMIPAEQLDDYMEHQLKKRYDGDMLEEFKRRFERAKENYQKYEKTSGEDPHVIYH